MASIPTVLPIVCEEVAGSPRLLRVATVTETYPPEINGVAKSAARFVDGLRARGHRIQVVRPRQDGERSPGPWNADPQGLSEVLTQGIAIPRYPDLRMGLPAKRALVRLWTFQRPDVVHVVTEGPLGWSALQAAQRLKLPVVSDFRTNFHAYSAHYGVGWLKRPILAYLRKFHNRTLGTLVPTEAMRAELAARGFQRLRVIARGVDTDLFNPARRDPALRAKWGAGPDDLVLLYVGRLAAEKNLAVLAAAYEEVKQEARRRHPRTLLVVVGDGPERTQLQARFPEAVFAGKRHGEDLAAHYASGDVFLFPSLTETFGNVTLEAMASGLAVVAFDYAAAAEVLQHDVSGLLAPFGDGAAFAWHAATLAADPSRVRRLGACARAEAAGRGWPQVVRELEAVLAAAADTVQFHNPGIRIAPAPTLAKGALR
jgi:glycosyltransferase involved in cell wall biosynthesis